MNTQDRIVYIDKRLKEIEDEAKTATEGKKAFLRIGYKAFLAERKALLTKRENDDFSGGGVVF
jgi:hypothetical protein